MNENNYNHNNDLNINQGVTNGNTGEPVSETLFQQDQTIQPVLNNLNSQGLNQSQEYADSIQQVNLMSQSIQNNSNQIMQNNGLNQLQRNNENDINQSNNFTFFNNNDNNVNKVYVGNSISDNNYFQEQNDVSPSILHTSTISNINNIKIKKNEREKGTFQVFAISITCVLLSLFMLSTLVFHIRFFHINGTSMAPTLSQKAWVLSMAAEKYTYGDIIAFRHENVVMIKRVVGLPGDVIDMDELGNVFVNGNLVEEPYLASKDLGKPEIVFPYTVHPGTYFVLGDNRGDSIDSRNVKIGGVKFTDIEGKVEYSLIPFKKLK